MHPHLTYVLAALDRSRHALRDTVAATPEPVRRLRPAPERWSVVEIIEHVSLVESRFAGMLAGAIAAAIERGLGSEPTPVCEPLPPAIATILADRVNRRSAPDPVKPTGALDEPAAWAAAEKARAALRDSMIAADGRALSTVVHAHQFFGVLNMYQWMELIAAHEMRHVAQVRETATALMSHP
jgi:hypothetical protein